MEYYPSGFRVEITYDIRVLNSLGFSKSFTLTILSCDSSDKNDVIVSESITCLGNESHSSYNNLKETSKANYYTLYPLSVFLLTESLQLILEIRAA